MQIAFELNYTARCVARQNETSPERFHDSFHSCGWSSSICSNNANSNLNVLSHARISIAIAISIVGTPPQWNAQTNEHQTMCQAFRWMIEANKGKMLKNVFQILARCGQIDRGSLAGVGASRMSAVFVCQRFYLFRWFFFYFSLVKLISFGIDSFSVWTIDLTNHLNVFHFWQTNGFFSSRARCFPFLFRKKKPTNNNNNSTRRTFTSREPSQLFKQLTVQLTVFSTWFVHNLEPIGLKWIEEYDQQKISPFWLGFELKLKRWKFFSF